MIEIRKILSKNLFLEKMRNKANNIYEKSWQTKLQVDAYMKGVNDTLNEIKEPKL